MLVLSIQDIVPDHMYIEHLFQHRDEVDGGMKLFFEMKLIYKYCPCIMTHLVLGIIEQGHRTMSIIIEWQ